MYRDQLSRQGEERAGFFPVPVARAADVPHYTVVDRQTVVVLHPFPGQSEGTFRVRLPGCGSAISLTSRYEESACSPTEKHEGLTQNLKRTAQLHSRRATTSAAQATLILAYF